MKHPRGNDLCHESTSRDDSPMSSGTACRVLTCPEVIVKSTLSLALVILLAIAACSRVPRSAAGVIATATPEAKRTTGKSDETTKDDESAPPLGQSVLELYTEINSDKYAPPPTQFRHGTVHPRPLPASAVEKTDNGYSVRLPSGAPVTTPAVYQGRVYVSGGFRSREFYAIEATSGKPSWGIALDDDGPSSPACRDETCVFGTESCTLFAVNAKTGALLWSWWLGDPMTSAPAIENGRVFASYPAHANGDKPAPPDATHVIAAFDLTTGNILWQKWLDSDVMSAPVAIGGFVYLATFGGTLVKLYEATGVIKYAIKARATSAPVVMRAGDGKRESMYFTSRTDEETPNPSNASSPSDANGSAPPKTKSAEESVVHTVDNGPKVKYSSNRKAAPYLDPSVQSSSSYSAQGKSNDSANGFSSGAPASANTKSAFSNIGQKSVHTLQAFQGSRVLPVGSRIVNTMGDEVLATDAESGEKLWSFSLKGDMKREGGALGTSPLFAGGSVFVALLEGEVVRLDPKDGKLQKSYPIRSPVRSQPVAKDGWIYVGTEDGKLVAIDTKDPSVDGWPMWGGNAARTGMR
jgi:outer membrane protein assembly factor BamB